MTMVLNGEEKAGRKMCTLFGTLADGTWGLASYKASVGSTDSQCLLRRRLGGLRGGKAKVMIAQDA